MHSLDRPLKKGLGEMAALKWGRIARIAAVAMLPFGAAQAQQQQLPWPGEQGHTAGGWPGDAPQSGPPPGMMSPAPMMGAPAMGGSFGGPPPGAIQQAAQACLVQFGKLREETERRGAMIKTAQERKPTREEMCKLIGDVYVAQVKWTKFSEDGVARCGIPPQIVKQLKEGTSHLAMLRKRVCEGGGAGGGAPPPPSLSEALGTSRLPTPDSTTTKRGGTLDTLTGNPIR